MCMLAVAPSLSPWRLGAAPLTLTPQRFQKARQPPRSWRSGSARDVAGDVIDVPFTITLASSDFTAEPHSSSGC